MTLTPELVEKLRAIQALAERAGTIEEGAAAAAKMSALLIKHGLTTRDLESFVDSPESEVLMNVVEVRQERYRQNLLWAVADAFSCMAILMPGVRKNYGRMMIVGHEHNIIQTEQTWTWLLKLADRMAREAWKNLTPQERLIPTEYLFIRSWKSGFAEAIARSYAKMKRDLRQEVGESAWALVPVMEDQVKKRVDEAFGNALQQVSPEQVVYEDAFRRGLQAGAQVNVRDAQVASHEAPALS